MKKSIISCIIGAIMALCVLVLPGMSVGTGAASMTEAYLNVNTSVTWLNDRLFMNNIVGVDGGYLIDTTGGDFARTLTKYNLDDELVWTIDRAGLTDFAVANDGSVIVVGNTGPWAASVGFIAKYLDGNKLWEMSFDTFITHSQLIDVAADQFNVNARSVAVIDDSIFVGAMYGRGEYEIALHNGDTESLSRVHQNANLNGCIFRFDIEGNLHGIKDIASETANSVWINHFAVLENGNLVVAGTLNTVGVGTATNIPELYSRAGHDAYVMVLDTNLERIGVRMLHSGGNLDAGNSLHVHRNDIFVSLITGPRGGVANVDSLLLLSQEERDAWPAGELLWQSGDGVLVGFDGEDIQGDTLFVHVDPNAVAHGATRDEEGNLVVINTISQGSETYSRIVKYNDNFDIVWETSLGEQDNETRVQVISNVHGSVKVLGRTNHRFDINESTASSFDGFIYKIGNYEIELVITAPYVEGSFTFGADMPQMQGYTTHVNGVFSWVEGQTLQVGEQIYAWKFTPTNPRFDSVYGYVTIYVQRASQTVPAVSLTVRNVTSRSIEFYPIQGAEFSIDGGATWQADPVFEGLNSSTNFYATFRMSQTLTHSESPQVESMTVSTLNEGAGTRDWRWLYIVIPLATLFIIMSVVLFII